MPELPEVETVRRGIKPYLINQSVVEVNICQAKLRWPVPRSLSQFLSGQIIQDVTRRGKYLLLHTETGTVIVHLGMSGHLRMIADNQPLKKHDHVNFILENGMSLRFNDPRRFGSVLWTAEDPLQHSLLCSLGPEPLSEEFIGEYLHQRAQRRHIAVKQFIMDGKIVVGVGNIYANESLFLAGIHPLQAAGKINLQSYNKLVTAIKKILRAAIESGGSTIRDFLSSDGKPGYFVQQLKVYGRTGKNCNKCRTLLEEIRISGRTTVFCNHCQKL